MTNEWIEVSKALPEEEEIVLASGFETTQSCPPIELGRWYAVAMRQGDYWYDPFAAPADDDPIATPTHWMPFRKLPG